MYTQSPFPVDYPGAVCWPAHPSNVIDYLNFPRGLVLHAPEEPVDDIESTPAYFARDLSPRRASTHYYADSDGDWYQMVPEAIGAVANGLQGMPPPPWKASGSLNLQTLNVEIEGYAAGMRRTCLRGSRQWNAVVRWVEDRCGFHNIPITRERILGHYQVSNQRTCPGTLDIDGIVADAQQLREEREGMTDLELIKLLADFEGTFHEAAGAMSRQAKLNAGLIERLQQILNLARQ